MIHPNLSELDNDTVLMHKIDDILYGEHKKPYSTGDALLMLIRNQIEQHERIVTFKIIQMLVKAGSISDATASRVLAITLMANKEQPNDQPE